MHLAPDAPGQIAAAGSCVGGGTCGGSVRLVPEVRKPIPEVEEAAAVVDCTAPVGVVDDAIGSTGTEPIVEVEAAEKAAAVVECTAPVGVVDAATGSTGTEPIVELEAAEKAAAVVAAGPGVKPISE